MFSGLTGTTSACSREAGAASTEATFLRATAHRQFRHSLMICEALASMELACRAATLRFIAWPEILARAPEATRNASVPWRLPVPSGGYLVPDAVFGIEYQADGAKAYRFFALEADRGKMPLSRTARGQSSYLGKLNLYRAALDGGAHKTSWGVPNLLVLTLTTGASRLAELLRLAERTGPCPTFLFKAVDEKALLRPLPGLLVEPWARAGASPLSIAESR